MVVVVVGVGVGVLGGSPPTSSSLDESALAQSAAAVGVSISGGALLWVGALSPGGVTASTSGTCAAAVTIDKIRYNDR